MRSDGRPNSTPTAAEKKPDAMIQTMMFTCGKERRQLQAGVGADPHEAAGAERQQPGIAGEQIEPDRGERKDQKRDHHRIEQKVVARERNDHERDQQNDRDADPVLQDREHRHVGGVVGLYWPASR